MKDTLAKQIKGAAYAAIFLSLLAAFAIVACGCTVVKKDGLFYGNVGFEKQISKVSIEKTAEGEKTTVEGVKNNTPQVVEAAVGAAVRAAK